MEWYVVDDGDTVLAGPFASQDEGITGILRVAAHSSEPIRLIRADAFAS